MKLSTAFIIWGVMAIVVFIAVFSIPAKSHWTTYSEDNYTVSKMCPDGKTAMQEISSDGSSIINLQCK